MRLSRSGSASVRRKDEKVRNKFKGKKKHKKLDAICEKAYNRSHKGVGNFESRGITDGRNELDLRRSTRTRKAPDLLDSSPPPPKKRRKVDTRGASSTQKVRREDGVTCDIPCSTSRNSDGQSGGWLSRLRSREKNSSLSGNKNVVSSPRGKRKLFENFDEDRGEKEPLRNDKKEGLVEKSTVVKSKRPGRINASNVLADDNGMVDDGKKEKDDVFEVRDEGDVLVDENGMEDDEEYKRNDVFEVRDEGEVLVNENKMGDGRGTESNDVFEVRDEGDGVRLEIRLECRSEDGPKDGYIASEVAEREETTGRKEYQLEEPHINCNGETGVDDMEPENLADERSITKVDGTADKAIETGKEDVEPKNLADEGNIIKADSIADQAKDEGHPPKPIIDETFKKWHGQSNDLETVGHRSRIKLGRHCGLCGGGIDGKPPKILVLDGTSSDNEGYSGSSASEEPNYDALDGFGNDSGWLGRLLGPINDRFGIAGIWVHQQCAVWSPEVYFAGLGCLKNVRAALYRGRVLKCSRCRRSGATIGCRVDRCPKTYHLPCARAEGCVFDHRKFLIACSDHRHLFQHGIPNSLRLKKMKLKKLKLELRKISNDASRKDIEAEEKWLENCGEDEEFLKRESKRLQRDLWRIAPVYIGGSDTDSQTHFQGWESVAGLQDVIQCMKEVVILPLLYPEFFNNMGLNPPRGVLLHGFPGTGKTLVVRALVGSCARGDKRIAYFARKGADCLGKYVGDAERQLRLLFQVAEKSQPSIIFFDEIDGLAPCRTKKQDQTHSSVVSTLLALMDGLKSRGSVIVIGATNRPDAVDPALRRPGRFDREIYFPLPSAKDREAILSLHTQKWPKPITGPLLKWVVKQTLGFAGADLQALCTQAAIIALKRTFPLKEVLSAAETKVSNGKRPSVPNLTVEERDWLHALSCAPPPCSRRECRVAVSDVVSLPLSTHLVPCLLHPLVRLIVFLYLDEHVWLPPPLKKASALVKNVIVSALDSRRLQSDNWWLHVDDLLHEVNVTTEIEKNLLLANVLLEVTNFSSSDVMEENSDDGLLKLLPSHFLGTRSGMLRNMCHTFGKSSGFQLLISGNPRSGQRHLASCLLHCFVGNVDIWKVDLASMSHEGQGDMILGLTEILMRCASTNLCVIYMPRIELWAIEMYNEAVEDHHQSPRSTNLQTTGNVSCDGHCEDERSLSESLLSDTQTGLKNVSYLWTSFIEQLESIRVNKSLIIMATSELPFSMLPDRMRLFFGIDIMNCKLSSTLDHKVPRFSVQLDGKFDRDRVISSFAAKLSKDVAQHFVQSIYCRNHIHESTLKDKVYDKIEADVAGVCHSKSSAVTPSSPVTLTNKFVKVKSSLMLAISSVGYQILCYPHFAELCWVTSKLKEGPYSDVNGPWKGWPFNSCIVRPINAAEKAAAGSVSVNMKCKVSGVVRGLVAIGLSAYRGEYNSPREVCLEVRKVSEILVKQIDDKIQAGKERSQFFRLLSQVAYLEDVIISWAQNLQSLETSTSDKDIKTCVGSLDNHLCKTDDNKLEVSNENRYGVQVVEEALQKVEERGAGCSGPTNSDNGFLVAGDDVVVIAKETPQLVSMDYSSPVDSVDHSSPVESILLPNHGKIQISKEEAPCHNTECDRDVESMKLPNGIKESIDDLQSGCFCGLVNEHRIDLPSSPDRLNHQTFVGLSENDISYKDATAENSNGNDPDVCYLSGPSSLAGGSSSVCFYQCCSICFANLHNLLLRIINLDLVRKTASDSTVEDVHEFLSSLSVSIHLALNKMSPDGISSFRIQRDEGSKNGKYFDCWLRQGTDVPECESSAKRSTECVCHATNVNSTIEENCPQIPHGLDSRFIFRDGVLATSDTDMDVPYHCEFESLCLCFLIEWLIASREPFD